MTSFPSPYARFPLRVTGRAKYGDPTADNLLGSAQYIAIVFRNIGHDYFTCMACAECGREWNGTDWQTHGEHHQMGLDYALKAIIPRLEGAAPK